MSTTLVKEYRTIRKSVSSLKPSPENTQLYRSADNDPDMESLARSIQEIGLQEPLIITLDKYIVSGHRRHAALLRIGQQFVWCRVLPCRRDRMSRDEYIALLREHNRQRNKTVAEQMREELLDIDPAEAYERLRMRRNHSMFADVYNGVEELEIEGRKNGTASATTKPSTCA